MSNTQKENQLTKGKKLGIMDYVALYKMSMRSYFWRVDGRHAMASFRTYNTIDQAIWFMSIMICYGLPLIFAFGLVSAVQGILLTPLRWIIPALRANHVSNPSSYVGLIFSSITLMLMVSPIVFNKERLFYNLHFTRSAWWNNTGILPRQIIQDRGLYGEYIATMAAEQNMKKFGLYGRVFNSVLVPKEDGNFNEVDVICVNEAGIQVIEAKYRGGSFTGRLAAEKWTQKIGQQVHENITNPLYQNNGHINCLINYLFKELPNGSARTKASFFLSYVNVALMTNTECDGSGLDGTFAPTQFFLGPAEGANGYIKRDLKKIYKRSFSKKEVDEICAALEKISGYSYAYIQEQIDLRQKKIDAGVYDYKYFYSVVRLESVTCDGGTEINDLICREEYDWEGYDWRDNDPTNKVCMFRYYMDPNDLMFKAFPNSRMKAQSAKTTNLNEIQAYYNRIMDRK